MIFEFLRILFGKFMIGGGFWKFLIELVVNFLKLGINYKKIWKWEYFE